MSLADSLNKQFGIKEEGKVKDGIISSEDGKQLDIEHIKEETKLPGDWKELELSCPGCTSDQFVYVYDDRKTFYCLQCDQEFDLADIGESEFIFDDDMSELVSDRPEKVKELADKIVSENLDNKANVVCEFCKCQKGTHFGWCKNSSIRNASGSYTSSGSNFSYINNCTHKPQQIIDGDGWGVWAGRKIDCASEAKNFDVVLNLTFTSIKEPHIIPIPELAEYADYNCNFKEIQLDWPDYGVISLPRSFWEKLLEYLAANKLRMLVFCLGGHGRTGTALAIMMNLALGMTPSEAKSWIRRNYCDEAIESLSQDNYIEEMAKEPNEVGLIEKAVDNAAPVVV